VYVQLYSPKRQHTRHKKTYSTKHTTIKRLLKPIHIGLFVTETETLVICLLRALVYNRLKNWVCNVTQHNILLFIDSPFRKLVLRFSIISETSAKLKNSWQSDIMSGEAVLNILKSTRFAEKFRDFSWVELRDKVSEAYNKQGMHLMCHLLTQSVRSFRI